MYTIHECLCVCDLLSSMHVDMHAYVTSMWLAWAYVCGLPMWPAYVAMGVCTCMWLAYVTSMSLRMWLCMWLAWVCVWPICECVWYHVCVLWEMGVCGCWSGRLCVWCACMAVTRLGWCVDFLHDVCMCAGMPRIPVIWGSPACVCVSMCVVVGGSACMPNICVIQHRETPVCACIGNSYEYVNVCVCVHNPLLCVIPLVDPPHMA